MFWSKQVIVNNLSTYKEKLLRMNAERGLIITSFVSYTFYILYYVNGVSH